MEKRGMIELEYAGERVQLRPCPFCGSDPMIHSYRGRGPNYSIRCDGEFGVCWMMPQTLNYPELERAAADWNMRPPEPNDPLTLEELREMNGPVWIERHDGGVGGWAILTEAKSPYGFCVGTGVGISWLTCDEYGKGWIACRRRPEEESHTQAEPAVPSWAGHLNSRFLRME